jgi:hypothetical protein
VVGDRSNFLLRVFPRLQILEAHVSEYVRGGRYRRTFLHQSRWLRAMSMHISRKSATFCRWKRSRSAWIVELAYLRSCADKCNASSSCSYVSTRMKTTTRHLPARCSPASC